jgi:hypothetical protein
MTAKKMVLVVAMALLPSLAFGSAVTYSTSGSVTGASFIVYQGVSNRHIPANHIPASNVSFGKLKITCAAASCTPAAGATLTVTISEKLPGVGMGSTSATLAGTFTTSGGTLTLVWSGPVSITAGGVTTIYTPVTTTVNCVRGICDEPLRVNISQTTTVPEPSAELLLGLGTLGLMGLAAASRKLNSV